MNIAVIYRSKYGTTKQYAEWIAKALDATLFESHTIKAAQLNDFDMVVYGGGLYAGGISGIHLVAKTPCKKLVLFTVGLATPENTDYSEILKKNLSPELRQSTKVFHFQGGIDYKKLGLVHRCMMAMMMTMIKNAVAKKKDTEIKNDDREFMETYGKKVNFTNQQNILPLVEYCKAQTDNPLPISAGSPV